MGEYPQPGLVMVVWGITDWGTRETYPSFFEEWGIGRL